ncbi:MAG: amidohydrolase family protein [Firmicutes bacterium]|nr:amidohydrolase family protein [Bacillota bacterium]
MKTLLKNGNIIDGTGAAAFVGDVLLDGDKIVSVGKSLEKPAGAKVVDCTGLCVAPGFIDAHSHNDFFVGKSEYFAPFVRQGITTQITGNCGFSVFGIDKNSPHTEHVGGGLFKTEKPSGFTDFLKNTKGKLHLNVAPLIGHGTTRIATSGMESKPLSPTQIDEMLLHVDEAMKNGALGGSLGLMYQPGLFSKKDELVAFAKKIKEYDGILTVHPRACSKVAPGYPLFSRKPHIEIALNEVAQIAKESGVRTQYSHLIHVGKATWKYCDRILKKFNELKAQGIDIGYDVYAYSFGTTILTVFLPAWYLSLPKKKKDKQITKSKIGTIINITKLMLGFNFSDFMVAYISEEHKHYEGKTILECAKMDGISDFDMYLKLVDLSEGKGRVLVSKYNNDEIIKKLMQDENSVFMTDAWLEETGFQNAATFQCFPQFLVTARDNNMQLEQIIHKMTGKTAARYQLENRGVLKSGNFADVTIFDCENLKVNVAVPESAPKGIKYVFINGELVVDNDTYNPKTVGMHVLKN